MSRDRDPYERTLEILRRRLRAGAFGEGKALQIQPLAAELGVSSTPVREALSRLHGEGLIERASGGYVSARYDVALLGGLYRLDEVYARAAFPAVGRRLAPMRTARRASAVYPGGDHLARSEALLGRLGAGADQTLVAARRNLWDRLAPFRSAEVAVFDDLEAEASALGAALEAERRSEILALVRIYFRRRQRRVAEILEWSRAPKYQSDIP